MRRLFTVLLVFLMSGVVWGQVEIFNESGGGSAPVDWTFNNNNTANDIDKTDYWLVEAGSPSDEIITSSYDLSTYDYAILNLDVATFGSGTANPAKIEISYDGGSTYTQSTTSSTPSSSTYVEGGPILLNSVSSQVVIKISNNGASGRGVRLQNIILTAYSLKPEPSNHASDFSAVLGNPGHTSTNLSWTDAVGGTEPDGYIIKGSNVGFGSISAPVDGTPEADDVLVKNILQGTQEAIFSGLNTNTTYYFKIYPFTNVENNINYKTDGSVPEASTTTYPNPTLVINEILADPAGDANGDGSTNTSEDEFVELINDSVNPLDVSGWQLFDALGQKHLFPANTIIPGNESVVVFGGGTPTNIPGISQTASTGSLALNNAGDDVIIKDDSDVIIVSYTYGSEGGNDQSLARNPDISGNFDLHSNILSNPVNFSPGSKNTDGTPLPVELTSFTAASSSSATGDMNVLLSWQTATEVDNYGFEIERQKLGDRSKESEAIWNNIGFVEGHGNSNSPKQYTYTDEITQPGTYSYRLKQIDTDGSFEYSGTVTVSAEDIIPDKFDLFQNYPNPFNPVTKIKYSIPSEAKQSLNTTLKVYDIIGREVAVLVNEQKEPGVYEVTFDASKLSSGLYFYSLSAAGKTITKKMMLLR